MDNIKEIYSIPDKVVVTAHRGFSGKYPENTVLAFEKAIQLGVDFIEFDIRETADDDLVVIHDSTLERTTDGVGLVSEHNLKDLKKLNASYWVGTHSDGFRQETPAYQKSEIPTFEETLELFAGKVLLNIQVYVDSPGNFEKITNLYDKHNLYDQAFLHVSNFKVAKEFLSRNSRIEICVGEDRGNLERHKEFGMSIIQPQSSIVTPEFCEKLDQLGFRANMFYSNNHEDNLKYLNYGIKGILTDRPDILIDSINKRKA